jgi:DNA polymerase III delta prime subunit
MKFLDTHFNEYIESNKKINLHPSTGKIYDKFPENIEDLNNLLFYGPPGVGKYTQMLSSILKYSSSDLKYDKKICITFDKNNYFYKISDIHVEIDMSLLGCNSKLLWNDIYIQLIDVASAKPNNTLIVVCKNFQNIHSELLDNFYSYMQTTKYNNIKLKFIIMTTSLCFIPSMIVNNCKIINIPRPTKTQYSKCIKGVNFQNININNLTNIKHLQCGQKMETLKGHVPICNHIITKIVNTDSNFSYANLRDLLYDILIYDIDIYECMWHILEELVKQKKINSNQMVSVITHYYDFFKLYNNNYRPIYHLESIMFYLISIIKSNES